MSARKEEKISPEKIEEFLNDQEKRGGKYLPCKIIAEYCKISTGICRKTNVSGSRQVQSGKYTWKDRGCSRRR